MMSRFLPEHDTDAAVEFLKHFHPKGPWHLVAIGPDAKLVAKTVSDEDKLWPWIEKHQGERNEYFHVNRPRDGVEDAKARKVDIVGIRALHVDVDINSSETFDALQSFRPRPTAIVFSGGGYQAYWMLEHASDEIVRAESCNKALAKKLGGDNCHNADRLMRLPGTINLPNAKKRAAGREPAGARLVEADWSRTYKLDEFETHDPVPAGPKGAVATVDAVREVDLIDLPPLLSDSVKQLIQHGDDLEAPIGSPEAHFPSRSEAVFRVACALVEARCSDEMVAGVLINPAFGISVSVREKRNPPVYALKQAKAARAAVESGWPDRDKDGRPRATMRNAYVALRRLGLTFSYDKFRYRKRVAGTLLEDHQGEITDDAVTMLRKVVIDEHGFDPRSENVRDAISTLCLENATHPVRDMLDGLAWDGTKRVGRWLETYLAVEDSPYTRAVSVIFLVAAVRRIRHPGTKFDQVIVLEGTQGTGKSTALQILAGPENHSDQEILTVEAKQQIELMEGVWIYEIGEISGLNKAEIAKTKAFASRTTDQARMAYGYHKVTRPRQSIFVGTTNEDTYLRDQTGNRRFWPIRTGFIDLEALRRDRDQLWAEAAMLEAAGTSITLPEDLWEAAAAEQAQRLEEDPWQEVLSRVRGQADGDVVRIATTELLSECLQIPIERQNVADRKRVAALMKGLGWIKTKYRVHDAFVRGYQRRRGPDHRDDIKVF